jgi:hypothetical protein
MYILENADGIRIPTSKLSQDVHIHEITTQVFKKKTFPHIKNPHVTNVGFFLIDKQLQIFLCTCAILHINDQKLLRKEI